MPFPLLPVLAGAASLAGGIWANAASAREARRNREFQERMSSTAHQREVADLRAAGINPMLRHMSGASSPSGGMAEQRDPTGGVSTALMMKAQLDLTKSQTEREKASAMLLQQQRFDLLGDVERGSGRPAVTAQQLRELDLKQRQELLPQVLAQAKAEVARTVSSARAANANATLDEAAAAGAKNLEDLEKRLGEKGPAVRLLFELLRTLRGVVR